MLFASLHRFQLFPFATSLLFISGCSAFLTLADVTGLPPGDASGEGFAGIYAVETAVTFARKRIKTMQSKPQVVITRRLWSALSRRGFDSETIRIVMNKVGLDIAEDIDT